MSTDRKGVCVSGDHLAVFVRPAGYLIGCYDTVVFTHNKVTFCSIIEIINIFSVTSQFQIDRILQFCASVLIEAYSILQTFWEEYWF